MFWKVGDLIENKQTKEELRADLDACRKILERLNEEYKQGRDRHLKVRIRNLAEMVEDMEYSLDYLERLEAR